MGFAKSDFGEEFIWGVSTAAYQIEGAWDADGKSKSIWDVYSHSGRKIFKRHNGDVACDFYHRYREDLAILHRLKIPNFRFSISWSRIIPNGIGNVNMAGIDFYNSVIDSCIELGIEPWITIYHWDLPYELEKKGGWTNREIINWFCQFAEVCVRHFGDRVKNWIILNEPMAFAGAGYFMGIHAPGKKGIKNFLAAVHHAAICQAEGGRIVKGLLPWARVGTSFSASLIQPKTDSESDVLASIRADALLNRLFVEPLAGLGYPIKELKILNRLEDVMKDGDEKRLSFNMDFIGLQCYTREIVTMSRFVPYIKARIISAGKRNVETTQMNWEIYPESIYMLLLKFSKYSNFKEIIITENGAAFDDKNENGKIHDNRRIKYFESHIYQVLRARESGVNVTGYFPWSLTDNFEWAQGYRPKFGLVHVDFITQDRLIKDSGYWYSNFLKDCR